MKKITYLSLLFVLAILINACSSDDDGGAASAETVVGSWEIVEVRYQGSFVFDDTEFPFDETFSTEVCSPTPVISFSADGSIVLTDFEVEEDFFDEEVVCFVNGEMSGTWEYVSGNTFIVDIDGDDPVEVNINLSNGNNSMTLNLEDNEGGEEFQVTFRGTRI